MYTATQSKSTTPYLTMVFSLSISMNLSFILYNRSRSEPTTTLSYRTGQPIYHAQSNKSSYMNLHILAISIIPFTDLYGHLIDNPTFFLTVHVLSNTKALFTTLTGLYCGLFSQLLHTYLPCLRAIQVQY